MLHDDDRWDPEFLARRLAFLEEEPECGFVFAGFRLDLGERRGHSPGHTRCSAGSEPEPDDAADAVQGLSRRAAHCARPS